MLSLSFSFSHASSRKEESSFFLSLFSSENVASEILRRNEQKACKEIAVGEQQRHTEVERMKRKSERQTSVSSWAHFVRNQVNEKH